MAPALYAFVLLPTTQWSTKWYNSSPKIFICTPKVWVLPVCPGWVAIQLECRGRMGRLQPLAKAEVNMATEEFRGWLLAVSNPVLTSLPGHFLANFHSCFVGFFKLTSLFQESLCNSLATVYSSWLLAFPLVLPSDALIDGSEYSVHLHCLHCCTFLSSCCPSRFAKGEWREPAPQGNFCSLYTDECVFNWTTCEMYTDLMLILKEC